MQDLPFQTLTQFTALGITLIAGWFLGLASRSGGGKWRNRYTDLEMENAGYRDRAETDLRDAAKRIRELEAENARLREAAPLVVERAPAPESEGHSTATVVGAAVAGAVAGAAVTHAVENRDEPQVVEHVEPAHVAPAHVEPASVEPAPVEPVHAEPVHHDAPAADAHPAPAGTHPH